MVIKRYGEVEALPVTDAGALKTIVRWVIAEEDGAKNFYMRIFEIEPEGCTPLHHHAWEHEIFVFQGKGTLIQQGREVPVCSGNVVFIPPHEEHQFKNSSTETLKFVCLVPSQK
ncbi:MAG: cupin domain-containing protein [Deltaproteobacteria bacterium]|nr:cupin domain-containing protein [Deltaproteobacteria bacterium]